MVPTTFSGLFCSTARRNFKPADSIEWVIMLFSHAITGGLTGGVGAMKQAVNVVSEMLPGSLEISAFSSARIVANYDQKSHAICQRRVQIRPMV